MAPELPVHLPVRMKIHGALGNQSFEWPFEQSMLGRKLNETKCLQKILNPTGGLIEKDVRAEKGLSYCPVNCHFDESKLK